MNSPLADDGGSRFFRGPTLTYLLLALITAIGAWYRFVDLGIKTVHWDESVNALFLFSLLDHFEYAYNPAYYHGPLLYFISAPALALGHRTLEALRFTPALIGTLAIPSLLLFRHQLGRSGILVAATYLAVAPIEVYFSRTAIHEIYNIFFNFTLIGSLALWSRNRNNTWVVVAGISLACLFATKETTLLTLLAMTPALLAALLISPKPIHMPSNQALSQAATGFAIVWVLLFSSFFTNLRGLIDFFAAFLEWGKTGVDGQGHDKVYSYFVTDILWPYYRPLLVAGILGMLWGCLKRDRLAIFLTGWFACSLAGYSIIPYKTPWCIMSFSGALFLGTGLLVHYTPGLLRWGLALGLVALVPWYGGRGDEHSPGAFVAPRGGSLRINLEEYDVVGHGFVYAQGQREYQYLIDDLRGVLKAAALAGQSPRMFLLNVKNPLRFYFQDLNPDIWRYTLVGEDLTTLAENTDIFAVPYAEVSEVEALFETGFMRRRYHDRPNVYQELFVREGLWETYLKAAEEGKVAPPSPGFVTTTLSSARSEVLVPE